MRDDVRVVNEQKCIKWLHECVFGTYDWIRKLLKARQTAVRILCQSKRSIVKEDALPSIRTTWHLADSGDIGDNMWDLVGQ